MLKTKRLLNLEKTIARDYLEGFTYPWEALGGIRDFILFLGNSLDSKEYTLSGENVWVHKSAEVARSAFIAGPCIIGRNSQIRHCAFIRSSVIVGESCVVGNSTELKNSILFDGVHMPHLNYAGDSILGYKAHLGAGAVISNVKSDRSPVAVKVTEGIIETGLKKFGAIIGDRAEIGCNTVINPGTVIGRNTSVYPLSCVRGEIPADSIYKSSDNIVVKE